jgi:chromosome segregation ATPase
MAKSDAEVLDKAIDAIEALHRNLWTWRAMVKELGDVKTQYDATKSGLAVFQQQQEALNAELEGLRTQLAAAQKEAARKQQAITELDAEIAEKQRMLEHYSKTIERITGAAA